MTTEELNTIVQAVIAELEKSGVDFDYTIQTAEDTDLVFVIRGNAPDYQGKVITWKGLLDIITAKAEQAKNDAVSAKTDAVNAKNIAQEILTGVQNKGTEINNFVATSKSEIETQKNEAVETVRSVYRNDLNAESTARQTADNTLQQNIDSEASTRAEADTAIGARIDSETTTRESEVAELERVNAIQKYEIENLKAKAEGQIYREEIIDANTYKLDIPSSVAPYAEVQNIGGKSVVWNQFCDYREPSSSINGITYTNNNDGSWTVNGTSTGRSNKTVNTKLIYSYRYGHKYYLRGCPIGGSYSTYCLGLVGYSSSAYTEFVINNCDFGNGVISTPSKENTIMAGVEIIGANSASNTVTLSNMVFRPQLFDLTQMFGSGNEPTLEECKKIFSAEYYPYDSGTIKSFPVKKVKSVKADGTEVATLDVSSVTSNLRSVGSVHDEWSNGKVTKRVGFVNIEDLNFNRDGDKHWYTSGIPIHLGLYKSCISNKLSYGGYANQSQTDRTKWYLSSAGYFELYDDTATSQQELKNNYAGTVIQFELDSPTEETVPEIDNFIQVEGGGTLTFESDETIHMPVPSTNRFVVDLT